MSTASVTISGFDEAFKQLDQLESVLQKDLQAAMRAAGNVVKKRAKQLAPRSKKTGTRKKWSKSQAAARSGNKEMADTISVQTKGYSQATVATIGPAYPAGAVGHLVEGKRKMVLWGVPVSIEDEADPFLAPAAIETKQQQQDAMVSKLRQAMNRIK